MSRKITVGAALALALLMVAASIPLTMMFAQREQNKLIPNLPALIGKFTALDEIQRKVNDNFFANPATDAVNAGMVRGYIAGLNDSESRYLNAEEYQSYTQRLAGEEPELGIVLKYSPDVVGLVIDQVKAGSTAAVSGLRPGDHIIKAESAGRELFNLPEVESDKAAEEIAKFHESTSVSPDTASISITITFKRGGNLQPPVNVMLGSAVSSISAELKDANMGQEGTVPELTVGYIKIFHFFKNTASQIEAAIKDLSNRGAVSYILDVRGCYEGNLDSVCAAIDLFAYVPQDTGAIVTVHKKDGSTAPKSPSASNASNNMMSFTTGGWIAVLIDKRTSGVAELFAYDLRAFNRGKVYLMGEPTRGINTVQDPFPLSSVGGAALLTVGTLVPYGGDADWNKEGVQPNDVTADETAQGIVYRISGAEQQLNGALGLFAKLNQLNSGS